MMEIRALILDAGGVVMHEDPADYDRITVPHGFTPGQVWEAAHSVPEYRPSRLGEVSPEVYHAAIVARLRRESPSARVEPMFAEILRYYREHNLPRPVMCELLMSLKGRIKLGLLSNGSPGATQRYLNLGLGAIFDEMVCSGEAGVVKPDDEAYRLTARRLGVAPEDCAFVDDVAGHVEAARALSMRGHVYHHARHDAFLSALREWRLMP